MSFDNTAMLWLLSLIIPFAYFSFRSFRTSNRWIYSFARNKKKFVPYLLTTIFFGFTFMSVTFSLAEPKFQYEKTYFNRAGIEIAIGIDVSKSMLAEDVAFPAEGTELFTVFNRLNRARYFALNLLSELHGEWVGVYMFASKGVEIVPFTTDYGYCRYVLKHLNETEITIPGSDLGEAVKSGVAMLENSRNKGAKIIILISDGEDISLDKSSIYTSAQRAAEKRIKIYPVGIGTGKGVLIPIRNEDGTAILNYYIDEDGTYLKTSLIPDTLKSIATITGGEYFRLTEEIIMEKLMGDILKEAKTVEETKSVEPAWFNLSPVFLIAGLVFFIVGILINR